MKRSNRPAMGTDAWQEAPEREGLVPACKITRYPANRRVTKEDVEALAADIQVNGLINAVVVRPHGAGLYQLVAGERRLEACRLIALDFPVRARILDLDDKHASLLHGAENFQRKDLDPVEQAETVLDMKASGCTADEIAARLNKSRQWVYKQLKLTEAEPDVLAAVRDRKIPVEVGGHLAAILDGDRQRQVLRGILFPFNRLRPLGQKEALQYIRETRNNEEECLKWESRRAATEKRFPGATWLPYLQAIEKLKSGKPVKAKPDSSQLALGVDLSRVPTWGKLAQKWGAPTFIGISSGRAIEMVEPGPIIEVEIAKASPEHGGDPSTCIFNHPTGSRKRRSAQKCAREIEAEQIGREVEDAATRVMNVDDVSASKSTALCIAAWMELERWGLTGSQGVNGGDESQAATAYLRAGGGFEALGRFVVANVIRQSKAPWAIMLADGGPFTPHDFQVCGTKQRGA